MAISFRSAKAEFTDIIAAGDARGIVYAARAVRLTPPKAIGGDELDGM
ncbi:hypothetical protein Q668_06065 [Alcanivorax sp. PN-3]|nr:hypothetical protein Q668_06065 [Alcanivorax sp. PN-3]